MGEILIEMEDISVVVVVVEGVVVVVVEVV